MECDIDLVRHHAKKFAQRSCLSKTRYPSGAHALRHAARRLCEMTDEEISLGAYRCNICRGWHLTSKTMISHWSNDLLMVQRLADGTMQQRSGTRPWQPYDEQALPSEADIAHTNYRIPIPDAIDPADDVEPDPWESDLDLSHWYAEGDVPADPVSRRYWLLEMLDIEMNFTLEPAEEGARRWQALKVAAINAALRVLPKPERCADAFSRLAKTMLTPEVFQEISSASTPALQEEARQVATERRARRQARAVHARSARPPATAPAAAAAAAQPPEDKRPNTAPSAANEPERQPVPLNLVSVTKRNLEQHEARSCATKRRFELPRFILQAMIDSLRRPDQDISQLAAYRCELCSGWHMTRQTENLEWNPDMFAVLRNDESMWVRVGGEQWQEYDRHKPLNLPGIAPQVVDVATMQKQRTSVPSPGVAGGGGNVGQGVDSWLDEAIMPVDPLARRFWLLEILQIESVRTMGAAAPAAKRDRGARIAAIHRAIAALPRREKGGHPFKQVAYDMLPAELFTKLCEAAKALEKQIQAGETLESTARAAARTYAASMGWCEAPSTGADGEQPAAGPASFENAA